MTLVPARLRWLAWAAQWAVAVAGGWVWFGNAGAALMALWLWHLRPAASINLDFPHPVHWVRLSRFAVTWNGGPARFWGLTLRVYRDEMSAEAFARLRRDLKAACADGEARGG